ncbi:MBL fold metallo-hydrolase [Martelella sp. HB161492]|uniref:MBL fold metallo-hydrolase n=1 Tax=Martelella sp. HB161492 TaxID=2720726 RepID=UPI00158FECE7|nr:MBL fold metallo-hydrolase [Martelella sp. HB161492]
MKTTGKLGRRGLMKGVGLTTLAAPALLAGVAHAQEDQMTEMPKDMPETKRFSMGELKFVVVRDGIRKMDNPGTIFGADQPPETVAALLRQNFLPSDVSVNMFSPTLIDTGSQVMLFDTGMGEAGRSWGAGQLLKGLAAEGYGPEDIDVVVITHMHGDHINGLMEAGAPAFPNARYVFGQTEYDFWTDPARIGTPAEGGHNAVKTMIVPLAEKASFIADGASIAPGITAMDAPGHTPGHMVFMVESAGRQLLLTADTANHYVLSLQRPDWQVRFDTDPVMASATRRRIFDMVAADGIPFLGYHMPFPAVGYAEKQGDGYRFVPASYQFEL